MKRLLTSLALLLPLTPITGLAYELSAGGNTVLRLEQRDLAGTKYTIMPLTQFLQVDANKVGYDRLSFHLSGWGRVDTGDDSTNSGSVNGNLDAAYFRYKHPTANGEVKLGRLFVYESGAIEQIDGFAARADLLPTYEGLVGTFFAGVPVSQNKGVNVRGSSLVGGRLSYRVTGLLEIGATAAQENGMLRTGADANLKDYRRTFGGDLWLQPFSMVELTGRTVFDAVNSGMAENNYRLTFKPTKQLTIAGDYRQNDLKSTFSASNIRSLFNPTATEKMTRYGSSITYAFTTGYEVTADGWAYNRDSRNGSTRLGIDVRTTQMDGALMAGGGFHHVTAGEAKTAPATGTLNPPAFNELRAWGMYQKGDYSVSGDAIANLYDDDFNGNDKKTAYEIKASVGYLIMPALKVSADLSYADTPDLDGDVRGLIRLTFNYEQSTTAKGAGQ
jgi:hypothetical protein